MILEQNKIELHRKYVVAYLGLDITRHFRIVFIELVDKSARVLQIRRRFPSQLSVSLSSDFVL